MPKRIVDGEAVWTSAKLKQVEPPWFRHHYALWITLAEANGVFEANAGVIRSRVYSWLDESITTEIVEQILAEYARCDLLRLWQHKGKLWGYFAGMEKPGRLPSEAHLGRYKNLPPDPPKAIRDNPGESGRVRDRDRESPACIGLDRIVFDSVQAHENSQEENTDMSFKSNISDIALRHNLGSIRADDSAWSQMSSLSRVCGRRQVEAAFSDWASSRGGEQLQYPLSAFCKVSDDWLSGNPPVQSVGSPASRPPLAFELAFISNNRITFDKKQQLVIEALRDTYPDKEIIDAFAEFVKIVGDDGYEQKFGGKNFAEKAEQFIYTRRKRDEEDVQNKTLSEKLIAREQEKNAATNHEADLARQKAEAEDAAFTDDLLTCDPMAGATAEPQSDAAGSPATQS